PWRSTGGTRRCSATRRTARSRGAPTPLPEQEASLERVGICAEPRALGRRLEALRVPAAEDDVLGSERRRELRDHVRHGLAPALLAQRLEAAPPDIVLVGLPILIGKMRELHRLEVPLGDHGRAEAGAEAREKPAPAPLALE